MRIDIHFFVIVLAVFVFGSSQAKNSSAISLDTGTEHHYHGRSLRQSYSTAIEDKSLMSSIVLSFVSWFKTTGWLNSGKSVDDVKKILQLDKVNKALVKSHENYKYLQHFELALETHQLKMWLSKGHRAHYVWMKYKLNEVPAHLLKDNDGYKTYLHFAKLEDEQLFYLKGRETDVKSDPNDGRAELAAKVKIWASFNRPQSYVRLMLDISNKGRNSRVSSRNYEYYKEFGMLTNDPDLI